LLSGICNAALNIAEFAIQRNTLPSTPNGLIFSVYFRVVNRGHHLGSSAGNHPKGLRFTSKNNFAPKAKRNKYSLAL